ncbi:MAG: GNAT family N-acetyltransferase [Flavobacteriaceae bacterium]|nr:GNAT family N-acetyltransferase [Flavobacteriaceae bacterium]
MIQLQNEILSLRALEPGDIDLLYDLENDPDLWKYSNRLQPYSRDLLQKYIANAHKDIFEVRQIKFTICTPEGSALGFIDLFDYEPLHHRAGVGLVLRQQDQNKGYGKAALQLIAVYAQKHLQLHQLYANIAEENRISIQLFEGQGYTFVGKKKDWNFYEGQYHDESIYQKMIE